MKIMLVAAILFALLFAGCGESKTTLFTKIDADYSGIHFNNTIIDNDSFNVLDVENIYNGGGVGIGDFNNDGLQDIFFTGNTTDCKLYLNRDHFKFEDITEAAAVTGEHRFCRGVSVIDINNDGLLDIYICATLSKDSSKRENLLYINSGVDKQGLPHFANMAREYGLADTSHATMAAFFDYDNDGDLDMYMVVNELKKDDYPNRFRPIMANGENSSTGKLFRNDWNTQLRHAVYTDVSKAAGITIEGYGHGVNICDLNDDGYKDIYVTNDFLSGNILYINNRDGTFTDHARDYFKHTSANSMGQDIADINNDGLPDIVEVDMNPQDNYRKKMMMTPNNYTVYLNMDYYGYQYQYVHNVIQLNQGPRMLGMDSVGPPVFSDIGFLSGIAETDWSWTPLVTDFDNDGLRDIIITNGFPKDVTDHDFITFRSKAFSIAGKKDILAQVPEVKISNYAFRNKGDVTFADVSKNWGITTPSFSSGAAWVDLDNDGDLDFVVNNINDKAFVYQNNQRQTVPDSSHYLQVVCAGGPGNIHGLGTRLTIFYDHQKKQAWENTPYRGYLSTDQGIAHFGIGAEKIIDSLIALWPDGKKQVLKKLAADQVVKLNWKDAANNEPPGKQDATGHGLFTDITAAAGIQFIHEEKDYVDFNIQKLLPHKLSEYGPGLAAGDIDGNGLDDIVCGGPFNKSTQIFLQQPANHFIQRKLLRDQVPDNKTSEDTGLLLFDADGDGDLDLYIASGGYESTPGSGAYRDRLYINDGKGNYHADSMALPVNLTSKFCVRGIDYDKDGDLDLFVAGRVEPWAWPKPVSSFILRNDSKIGRVQFTDVTTTVAPGLNNIGLVCDALFTDFDNDGWTDLVLAGEWMPVCFFKNDKGLFKNITSGTGVQDDTGWWNSIAAGDFDNDGDIDYVVGNLGLNSQYRASASHPAAVYAKDFDNNGSFDAFPAMYFPASQTDQAMKLFPAQTREDAVKQMIGLRSKFQNYKFYAKATISELFSPEQLKDALVLHATNFNSSFFRNEGNGKFSVHALPVNAQFSVLNGMLTDDFDGDGNLDVLINGNDFGTEVSVGRYDALNGLLLKGDGKGNFTPLSILQSGIYIPGNGKGLSALRGQNETLLIAAGQNRGPLKIFSRRKKAAFTALNNTDTKAMIKYSNGGTQLREFYFGASFLSQSARFLTIDTSMISVTIFDNNGKARKIR